MMVSEAFERALEVQIIMLSPLTPHFASELWTGFCSVLTSPSPAKVMVALCSCSFLEGLAENILACHSLLDFSHLHSLYSQHYLLTFYTYKLVEVICPAFELTKYNKT